MKKILSVVLALMFIIGCAMPSLAAAAGKNLTLQMNEDGTITIPELDYTMSGLGKGSDITITVTDDNEIIISYRDEGGVKKSVNLGTAETLTLSGDFNGLFVMGGKGGVKIIFAEDATAKQVKNYGLALWDIYGKIGFFQTHGDGNVFIGQSGLIDEGWRYSGVSRFGVWTEGVGIKLLYVYIPNKIAGKDNIKEIRQIPSPVEPQDSGGGSQPILVPQPEDPGEPEEPIDPGEPEDPGTIPEDAAVSEFSADVFEAVSGVTPVTFTAHLSEGFIPSNRLVFVYAPDGSLVATLTNTDESNERIYTATVVLTHDGLGEVEYYAMANGIISDTWAIEFIPA